MTVDEVFAMVMRDEAFYKSSGGGLTLSGGEPMMQFEFSLNLLKKAKNVGLHTCIETCGHAPAWQFQEILPFCDLFLYDFKVADPDMHMKFTGSDNKLILANLALLDEMGARIILRCPIIPGVNDNEEHDLAIEKLRQDYRHIEAVERLPYHGLGEEKKKRLVMTSKG
jgi:pyruvate formate lyase activating enzyme